MTMSPDPGGVFRVLSMLTRFGLGGTQGSGKQFVSWIHEHDYCRITDLLLAHPEIADESNGIVNMTAPEPLPNRDFMRELRRAWHQPFGPPAAAWMIELGTRIMGTESELVLKSRRAVPTLLLKHGYAFSFPTWPAAATDLVARSKY
jgi:NAD dependent epimerase/dehydratase family enzyme